MNREPDITDLPDRTAETHSVLVVEDEPRLRDLVVRAVRDMELTVTGVANAESALSEMARQPAGIVVLDLMLPGMDGMALFEVIHKRWPGTRVIILTAFGDLETAQRSIRLGVVDFLRKPCSLGELEAALSRALSRVDPVEHPHASTEDKPVELGAVGRPMSIPEAERRLTLAALKRHGGNRRLAAEELGISVRTLYYRLSQWKDERDDTDTSA
ncbi:MAG: response regulator [Phycisphaera sp.]|nr:response regulator [Phycisphaera sp.]